VKVPVDGELHLDMLDELAKIATKGTSESPRVSAANALLDRGYGRILSAGVLASRGDLPRRAAYCPARIAPPEQSRPLDASVLSQPPCERSAKVPRHDMASLPPQGLRAPCQIPFFTDGG
jgi:hypothetical protein